MLNPDLSYYGFQLVSLEEQRDEFTPEMISTTLTLKRNHIKNSQATVETLLSDLEVMNKLRNSLDPAVKDAYEQLLTVMALTNGRDLRKGVGNDDS